jgi:ribosomal protein S12 methylthiotransferase
MDKPLKIFPVSLGCPKNRVDFEKTLALLKNEGYEITLDPSLADVIWINTCAFIKPAVQESIDTILELSDFKKDGAKLVVSGCLTARYGKEKLRELLPEVDEFLGIEPYKEIKRFEPKDRVFTESPFYAYLKVSEGCAHRCSYCTIPKIRGPFRSKPLPQLVEEATYILKLGVKELILVGQDTTLYGRDLGEREGLLKLLYSLSELPFEFRIRVLYLHPQHVDENLLLSMLSIPKVLPYFELPIQHAHPKILKAMNRAYSPENILKLISSVRQANPRATFRSTVIVGFPGEGDEEFSFLLEFLKEAEFDYLGAFPFYPEEGTPAEKLKPRVPAKERMRRRKEVLKLQQAITKKRLEARIGTLDEVLILEEESPNKLKGLASFQAPEIDGLTLVNLSRKVKKTLLPGDLIKVRITKVKVYDVEASPVGEDE